MTPDQRDELIRLLAQGEDISPEWARILFPPEKREYELVYYGKDREEDIIADALAVPLQPVRTFGHNGTDWHNLLIFGDNLQAIKTLLQMKQAGKLCNADGTPGARLVYIDPPFATKQEFRGTEDQKAYQDKLVGAKYIEFLRKRFILLRELMSDNGVIYVHLDWKKSHYARVVLDEVFGEKRFRNEIAWYYYNRLPSGGSIFESKHDTLLVYSKSNRWSFEPQYEKRDEVFMKKKQVKVNGKSMNARDENGNIIYLELDKRKVDDVWRLPLLVRTAGEYTGYPTQKTEKLLERVLQSSSKEGDIVLDAFAGSGTTCAVAEKLSRRWIAIDCGKLAIYTIQKRMLNLHKDIAEKGPKLQTTPFTLYNAGLYDFSTLKELSWPDWRFFALQLFGCRDEPHRIGGLQFDGYRQGQSVMVFNHMADRHKGACISEETVREIHEAVGSKAGSKVFMIAPALAFDFQQDYLDFDRVRYYALRIPYSIIHELYRCEFTALKQPADEMAVNDTVEAVGFDFIRTPELKYKTGTEKPKGQLFEIGFIKIETFKSDALVREPFRKKENLQALSMVMLDFDYDEATKVFNLDAVYYADALEKDAWKLTFRTNQLGLKMMAVFLDIYGNEARVLIDTAQFRGTKT
jgi:site-specific DNA-methyltransferase (adenine-specific)/adenine-specific DNA-methyltransferase